MTKEDIIKANGIELAVETFGERSQPAVLLIHGAGNSMLSWADDFCERLAAGPHFVVRYDSRDHGRSTTFEPGAPPYGLRDLVADAAALLDGLGLDDAHVVGLSQGAATAQLLALDHPERVASLTLTSSTPGGPGHDAPDLPGMSAALQEFFAAEPPEPDWADREAVVHYLVEAERPFAGPAFDEGAMRELAGRVVERANDIAASLSNPFMIDPGDPWRDRLGDLRTRTLVMHGDSDPMFPLEHGRAVANEIPGAKLLVLERTGHEYPPPPTWDVVVPAILDQSDASG